MCHEKWLKVPSPGSKKTFVKRDSLAAPVSGDAHTDSEGCISGRNRPVGIASQNLLILKLISYGESMKPDRLVSFHASSLLLSAKCLLGTFWSFLGSTPSQKGADAAKDHSTAFFPKSSKRAVVAMLINTVQALLAWLAQREGATTTSSDRHAASAFALVTGLS